MLERIERYNAAVNAWCHLNADGALARARESEARWMAASPMGLADGVPVGIKDNILVAGMPTRYGSKLIIREAGTARSAGGRAAARARRHHSRQDRNARARLEGRRRQPADRHHAQSMGHAKNAGRLVQRRASPRPYSAWARSISAPTAAARSAYRRHSPAATASSRRADACRPGRPRRLARLAHVGPMARSVADAALAMTIISGPDLRDVYGWISPAPTSERA